MPYPPFARIPGTGKPDPAASRPGKIPVPRDAKSGAGAIMGGIAFALACIFGLGLLLSLVMAFLPDSMGNFIGVPSPFFLIVPILVHVLAFWGDAISRSGDDWGMRGIVLVWVLCGFYFFLLVVGRVLLGLFF